MKKNKKKRVLTILLSLLIILQTTAFSVYSAAASSSGTEKTENYKNTLLAKNSVTGEISTYSSEIISAGSSCPAIEPEGADSTAGGNGITPYAIFGPDDRKQANPYDAAVAHLTSYWKTGDVTVGTAFVFADRALMTAAHCIYDNERGGWPDRVEIAPKRNGTSYPYGKLYATYFYTNTDWTKTQRPEDDYGFVELGTEISNQTGAFGFSYNAYVGEYITLNGYPGDKPQQQWYSTGTISRMDESNIYYLNDMKRGHSGSPVYNSERSVLAINTYESSTTNFGRKITKDVYDWMLSFRLNPDHKQFTVKYDANGGSGSMQSSTIQYNVGANLRANAFTKTGYHFTGWNAYRQSDGKWYYENASGSASGWYKAGSQPSGYAKALYPDKAFVSKTTSVNGDVVTMYAQWQINKYTVKYDANGGTGSMANTTVTWGTNTALRANAFKKTGYTFTGWNAYRQSDGKWYYKSANGSASEWYREGAQPSGYTKALYPDKAAVAKTSNVNNDIVTMKAQWKVNSFTIRYYSNGGVGSMADTKVTYGVATPLRANSFTRAGYVFRYWYLQKDSKWHYTSPDGTGGWYAEGQQPSGAVKSIYNDKQVISKTTSENNAVITAYAQWKAQYLYGDVNGDGTIGMADVTLIQNYLASAAILNEAQLQRADVNADGKVSIQDVTCIQLYLAGSAHNSRTGTPVV